MQNNLRIKTVKPIIKDAEPNKYVLDVDKSRDPGHAPFGDVGACQRSRDLFFFNFGTPSITFERKKHIDTSFSLLDLLWRGMTPKWA